MGWILIAIILSNYIIPTLFFGISVFLTENGHWRFLSRKNVFQARHLFKKSNTTLIMFAFCLIYVILATTFIKLRCIWGYFVWIDTIPLIYQIELAEVQIFCHSSNHLWIETNQFQKVYWNTPISQTGED